MREPVLVSHRSQLDENDSPISLLRHGHHFSDCPRNSRRKTKDHTPMDEMIQKIKESHLTRPKPRDNDN